MRALLSERPKQLLHVDVIRTDVLIVGAGPSGLTLACALARAGISFRLIDKRAQRSPYSRALVVHLRSLEIFDQLGIADGLLEEGNHIKGVRVHTRRKFRFELDLSALFDQQCAGCRFRGALLVEQNRTEAALDTCLDQLGAKVLFSHELLDFEDGATGARARCRDAKDRTYTVECQYIAGCDGAHSDVRQHRQISFPGSSYAQDFMLADVDIAWEQPQAFLQAFFDRRGFLVIGPMRHKTRLIAARGRYRIDAGEPTLDDFTRLVARLVPYDAELANPVWLARFHLHHRIAERFRAGRVCLAGDAAHIHSPAGGQGMNTGIQDAWNLGWKLAWALHCSNTDRAHTLLESYHEERFPVGQLLIQTTDRAFNVLAGQSWLAQFVRTCLAPWFLPTLASFAAVRKRAMYRITQLGIHYRRSRLCGPDPDRRHFTTALVPGDRMPDIAVYDSSLHRLLDPVKPTIVAVGTQEHIEAAMCKVIHMPPPTDDARRMLGLRSHGAFLLRPDGHIAARALTQHGLNDARLLRFLPQ